MNLEVKAEEAANNTTDDILNGQNDKTTTYPVAISPSNDGGATTASYKPSKDTNVIDMDQEVLRFSAPSKDFRDIVIQSHKGIPRYGQLHFKRNTHKLITNKAYKALLEMRFLKETFNDMDRSKLTKNQNSTGGLSKKNSEFAQNHVRILAGETLSDDKLKDYFCDTELASTCNFYNPSGERINVSYWGGIGNNEFAQNRSYTGFVKNYFNTLKDWSQTLYADGSEVAYYVVKGLVAEKYDFKEKGYWIGNLFSIGGDYILDHSNFLPYTENEKAIKHQRKKIFLPIDAQKAENYRLIPRSPVFVVFKVRVNPKPYNSTSVIWEYELESPILEFYKDVDLTDIMGEVDINTANLKQ
ncbi:hypothetical protein [Maribacter litoralis]|nr:hypothetical protein [Maribacter litoralis]